MPRWGPRRPGGGRKPTAASVVPFTSPTMTGGSVPIVVEPDVPLTADERVAWDRLAPRAIEARTLTAGTSAGMVHLVRLVVLERALDARIQAEGLTVLKLTPMGAEPKPHPLMVSHRQIARHVEAMLARFGLAPFGKPLADAPRPQRTTTPVNPWAALEAARAPSPRPQPPVRPPSSRSRRS